MVESHIGSTGLMNLIIGISIAEASRFLVPFTCTNDCKSSSQKSRKMLFRISSRVRRHSSKGASNDRFSASRSARSHATQHIKRECRHSFGPPPTSHVPSAGRFHFCPHHASLRRTSTH